MIKAVLFDMDGLLIDSERLAIVAEREAAEIMGFTMPLEVSLSVLGVTWERGREIMQNALGPDFDVDFFRESYMKRVLYMLDNPAPPIKKGAFYLLRWLKDHNIKRVLASSTEINRINKLGKLAGFGAYFDNMLSGETIGKSKPEPDIFLRAAESVGVDIKDCLVLEDSKNGLIAGRRSGAVTCMIPDLLSYNDELSPYVDYVLNDLTEVKHMIEKQNNINEPAKRIMVQAHRGASGYAPENTLSAFKLACCMGADGIECDIHLTSDDVFVVCHDNTIDRTSTGTGAIAEMPLHELKKYDYGVKKFPRYNNEPIPTLVEMLEVVKDLSVINIEIKKFCEEQEKPLDNFYSLIKNFGLLDKVIVSSFDKTALKELNRMHPDMYTCLLYGEPEGDMVEEALNLGCLAIHPAISFLDKATVDKAHSKGLKVNTWTVDSYEQLNKAKELNVDGFITNYPDRAFEVIK